MNHYSLPNGSEGKECTSNTGSPGDKVLIPGLGRFPAGGNGNTLQNSCLKNPMNRGSWQATVQRATKSWT